MLPLGALRTSLGTGAPPLFSRADFPLLDGNLIINGHMDVDVLDTYTVGAITANSAARTYGVDRWFGFASGGGAFTMSRSLIAARSKLSGANFLTCAVSVTSAPAAADQYYIGQWVEGYTTAQLGWGTEQDPDLIVPKPLRVSFWAQSSLSGVYGWALNNGGNAPVSGFQSNGHWVGKILIPTPNKWFFYSFLVPGNPSFKLGSQLSNDIVWFDDNSPGLMFSICLGAGANSQRGIGFWQYTNTTYQNKLGPADQTQWINNAGATFGLTGVRLDPGDYSPQYHVRPYQQELALCQRYRQRLYGNGTGSCIGFGGTLGAAAAYGIIPVAVDMRAPPTIVGTFDLRMNAASYALTSIGGILNTPGGIQFTATATGAPANTAGWYHSTNATYIHLDADF